MTKDSLIFSLIERERSRQMHGIELIASENFVSDQVMAAMGSVLTNKYAEGYPAARYYGGCEVVDEVERLAIERICKLYGAAYANVQPHSGAQANMAVFFAVMQPGDTFLVSCGGTSSLCRLEQLEDDAVVAQIVEENYQNTELPVRFYLFQGLPKGDKLELIIQKTVELGVAGIIPVEMSRCVMKLDEKKKKSRQARWQSIAESAAKQSKRNVIPEVSDVLT